MTEYIKKEHALQAIKEVDPFAMPLDSLPDLYDKIETIPAADVAPVVHATTTDAGWDEIYCEWKTCNKCQGNNVSTATYCNWCGARMDGGKSNAD